MTTNFQVHADGYAVVQLSDGETTVPKLNQFGDQRVVLVSPSGTAYGATGSSAGLPASVQGILGPGATGTINPVLGGGQYNPTGYTLMSAGQLGPLQVDGLSNLKVDEQYAPGYENNVTNRAQVEQTNSFLNVPVATTGAVVVKSGPGFLRGITINKGTASAIIVIYDNTAASGAIIGTVTMPSTLLASQVNLEYYVSFANGLTLSITTGQDLTVSFR